MITATSEKGGYKTRLSDGSHVFYADTPAGAGGSHDFQRPTDILLSAYASCINITTRMLLDQGGYAYDSVETKVDLAFPPEGKAIFYAHTEILGDVPEADKAAILERVKRCPVCKLLAAEKEFRELKG